MEKLLVILGPTASGKTDLGLSLAKKFNGEIISADSRQVYQGLDLGTGKLPGGEVLVEKYKGYWFIDGIKVWLLDVTDPKIQYNVSDYLKTANKIIRDISQRDKLPIIVGGSGLYIKGLLEGFSNLNIPVDLKLRKKLGDLSLAKLQQKLEKLSPLKWQSLNQSDRQNPRRLLRAIEMISMSPYRKKNQIDKFPNWDILKIGLKSPREILNKRIDQRLEKRIKQGLIEEGKRLLEEGVSLERMKQLGLEYGSLADLLANKIDQAKFQQSLAVKIHQYAKRQMTWFKKEKNVSWFDISQDGWLNRVFRNVSLWYHANNGQKN